MFFFAKINKSGYLCKITLQAIFI